MVSPTTEASEVVVVAMLVAVSVRVRWVMLLVEGEAECEETVDDMVVRRVLDRIGDDEIILDGDRGLSISDCRGLP